MTRLKFSAMTVSYIQYSLVYLIKSFGRLKIDNIELWAALPHYDIYLDKNTDLYNKQLEKIKNKLKENNMKIVMFTPETLAYPYSYSHPNEIIRNRTVEYMKKACNDALDLGCNQVFINSGCGLRDIPVEDSWKNCVDSFKKICKYAENLGINIVLEQLQPYESNLVINLQDCIRMKKDVGYDNLKICLDLVAMEVANEKIEDYFNTFGDDIAHIHLADSNHEILGDGNFPIDKYLEYLESINFDKYISLEINDSIYWNDPEKSLRESIRWLKDNNYMK
ncbi:MULTISPECIES: sugar phosphate isomerase/epimerase family protein [Anaerococcus]|uniref:sugar phosphate isomerase/epimerase family protein n=1 Tax=Anaerococcus TaxID=165779 RepID=UPI0024328940|nr:MULTISPECIES: sugar phosphate isomerase/epimerase [Anaerococcus]MDD7767081.1 sugar phosphate isomerase/epimerase [Anaerococcus vaginalis]MDY6127358.1 sugar phosphate isomerase/epimerase family protein [Anaerococcus sp.]